MKKTIILLVMLVISSNLFAQKKEALSVKEFRKDSKQKEATIIDVRTPAEFSDGHIKKAFNLDWKDSHEFKTKILQFDKTRPLYLYCHSGSRSEQALDWLVTNGFTSVHQLNGGFEAWKKAGKHVSKPKH